MFKGPTRDDYVLPSANYELAALAWVEACDPDSWPKDASDEEVDAYRRKMVSECEKYLRKVAAWEGFVLDARFGMRIQAGLDSVSWLKKKKNYL